MRACAHAHARTCARARARTHTYTQHVSTHNTHEHQTHGNATNSIYINIYIYISPWASPSPPRLGDVRGGELHECSTRVGTLFCLRNFAERPAILLSEGRRYRVFFVPRVSAVMPPIPSSEGRHYRKFVQECGICFSRHCRSFFYVCWCPVMLLAASVGELDPGPHFSTILGGFGRHFGSSAWPPLGRHVDPTGAILPAPAQFCLFLTCLKEEPHDSPILGVPGMKE